MSTISYKFCKMILERFTLFILFLRCKYVGLVPIRMSSLQERVRFHVARMIRTILKELFRWFEKSRVSCNTIRSTLSNVLANAMQIALQRHTCNTVCKKTLGYIPTFLFKYEKNTLPYMLHCTIALVNAKKSMLFPGYQTVLWWI